MALARSCRAGPSGLASRLKVGGLPFGSSTGTAWTVLQELEPGTIDVVVTSPPYNLGIKYRSYQDDMPRGEYLAWTDRWVRSVARALAPRDRSS